MLVGRSQSHEKGSTLVSVLVVMLALATVALALGAAVTHTAHSTVNTRAVAQSRASADAGMAALVAYAKGNPDDFCDLSWSHVSTLRYDVASSSCQSGRVTFTSTGFDATGTTSTTVESVYSYDTVPSGGATEGAIVSGDGSLNISSINVSLDGGVLLNQGAFDCNNVSDIEGNVIVRNGRADITNRCRIGGSVWAKGDVNCNSLGSIAGNLYAGGSVSLNNNCQIGGSVFADGNVTINNITVAVGGDVIAGGNVAMAYGTIAGNLLAKGKISVTSPSTILGAVISESTADSSYYALTAGSLRIAGRITSLQASKVSGNVESAKVGGSTQVAPDVTIGGQLRLGGTLSTWGSGPSVAGGVSQNVTDIVTPAVTVPDTTPPDFDWIEFSFDADEWDRKGYAVEPTPTCDFQNTASGVTWVNNRTTRTLIDAQSCDTVNLYNVTFNLRTDIIFVVRKADAQSLKLTSANSGDHTFGLLVSDNNPDDKAPTCGAGQGEVSIWNATMTGPISAIAYSPCTIRFGGNGSPLPVWNGQVYAGKVVWAGNGNPAMHLEYRQVVLPGLRAGGAGGGGGSGRILRDLESRQDRP